ncbi:hypothetical protein B488_04580 [Liberibacter crescens BT-1]|uniref:DUF2336 domain-containing protein n=1 Tax=Liberibacter crescens (strain BT-1) TaxID=1215343 RepID=L0EUC4_LIBCB|nr:DUF2336 domain-containing protein [Liberibacter crescens]AGA64450.1 hypothetical protein B488_04580 [Liberibacter crescens BT-1]AMC12626.1 hypothetical protein RL73_02410 [Liberibacter crescens]
MSVKTFIQWAKKAKIKERVWFAHALGEVWREEKFKKRDRDELLLIMMHLLDDPVPAVRLAFVKQISHSYKVPRHVILELSEDQSEIAGNVILYSPVLTDSDLVDIVGRGSNVARLFVASRQNLSHVVSAALAEVGCEIDIIALLENQSAKFSRTSLMRITERFNSCVKIRCLLIFRQDLPPGARYLLMRSVSKSLLECHLVNEVIGSRRASYIVADSNDTGTLEIIARTDFSSLPTLVHDLRRNGQLTPAFLMRALTMGKIDFIAAVLEDLMENNKNRVRSILVSGGIHAVRALYEAVGLGREISGIFVEATILWREIASYAVIVEPGIVAEKLLQRLKGKVDLNSPAAELLDMIEKLYINENRRLVRAITSGNALVAA